jgi:hypothetical protein
MILSRRSLITGLISLIAAPAIVRASNIMAVKVMFPDPTVAPLFYQHRMWWVTEPVDNGITRESLSQLLAMIKAQPVFDSHFRIVPPDLYEALRKDFK